MTFQEYTEIFQGIINAQEHQPPYDQEAYMDYTKLNWARMNRWLKKGVLSQELVHLLKGQSAPSHWLVITEPWCGDAAHTVPFIHLLAQLNPLITVSYELRDSPPFQINQYLSGPNKSKSIPVLVVRDEQEKDQFVWGPRPEACQEIYQDLIGKEADFETVKTALQQWYNTDGGLSFQRELFKGIKPFIEG